MNRLILDQIIDKFPAYLQTLENTSHVNTLKEKYHELDELLETEAMCYLHKTFGPTELPEWFEEWIGLRCQLAKAYRKADAKFPKYFN